LIAVSRTRIVLEGVPYHVTQRGNARQQIFFDERDYILYLDLVSRYGDGALLRILVYCLMPNHIHLIVLPERGTGMAQALGRTHADFARYHNLKNRACGHVWQARYFSTPWTTLICGGQWPMWSAIQFVLAWWSRPSSTLGRVLDYDYRARRTNAGSIYRRGA
jgi:putative transposase